MKKYFVLAITLLNYSHLFAQNYKINWEKNKDYALSNGSVITVPYFNNTSQYALNEYYVPDFKIELDGDFENFSFENVQTIPLSTEELLSFSAYDLLSEKINFSTEKKSKNNSQKTLLSVLPYIKKGNSIHKITSFSLSKNESRFRIGLSKVLDDSRSSALISGNWYKIKVDKSGVFKLDKKFFTDNGIPTSGYNLSTLKIYGNGNGRMPENTTEYRYGALQQIPIDFIGSEDNDFGANDYVIFHAKGPHQWYRPVSTDLESVFLRYNIYDDYSYYYINIGGANGKRIYKISPNNLPVHRMYTTYDNMQFYEKDSLNINQVGRQWVGEMLNGSTSFTKNFKALDADLGTTAYLKYSVVGKNANNTNATIKLNGNTIGTPSFTESTFHNQNAQVSFPLQGNDFTVSVDYNNSANPSGLAFINYFELKYKEKLAYKNQQFSFRQLENVILHQKLGFDIANSQGVRVWNVSNISETQEIIPEGSVYSAYFENEIFRNEFVAFKDTDLYTDISYVGKVANQNIRNKDDINLAIIVHPSLKEQAIRLAKFREEYNNIKAVVVTTDEVYNDFSSGSKDPIAIRDFLKHLVDNGNPLEYAILFGATSYDPKNRIQGNINLIPSFYNLNSESLDKSSTTDDYFVMLGDEMSFAPEAGNSAYTYNADNLNIAIGRLPARNLTEAKLFVDKIISYYEKIPNKGTSYGDWRTKIVAVSDDPDSNEVNTPRFDGDINSIFDQQINKFYAVNKLYIDAYQPEQTSAGLRYPIINQSIINNIELGTNFLMYYGHGGPRSWAQERIITGEELMNLNNFTNTFSRVPIVTTITCDFTVWDLPQYDSAGEMMLRNPNGGALSMITTNRPIGTGYGSLFNGNILEELFRVENHQNVPTGKALIAAKKAYASSTSEHAKVNLLGDPMVAISRPKQDIQITKFKVNGQEVNYNSHQIKALDFVEIEGEILTNSAQLDTNFNGTVQNILYEKPVVKSLRNNKGLPSFTPYSFTEEFKTIFKGNAKVNDGRFTVKYYVPKDINYEVGQRKLVLYAYSNDNDAVMHSQVIVGGLNENGINDSELPQGKLYMNNLNFANGGITDRDPYLIACLTDNTGINATGASIGHDIVATIDGKIQDAYVLNDYFESGDSNPCVNKNFEDYQKGQVIYQLKKLELGNHQVEVKFWDINNNSNTATLDFVVMEGGTNQIHIDKLLNWPNPFTNNTFFHFEHNCDTELDVMVQIYTISGKLVKTIKQKVSSEPFREGYRTGKYAIEWDGLDDFGDKIGKGTYLYKVNVKGTDSGVCKGNATAVERLVILK